MELISVIVPVYKVEKYLEKCVKSIINQTYKNLEIILVDDGSPDRSGQICDELAKQDDRIVVYHKENGGLSDARNYGVERARGEYIGFVDSDDYIHPDMYQHLYDSLKKEDVDVAECNLTYVYDHKEKLHSYEEYNLNINSKEYLKEYLSMERLYGAAWCRLIKAEIAKNLLYPKGKIYEDVYYALDLIKVVDRFAITSKPYYYYLMRNNSITNEKFSDRQMVLIDIIEEFKDYTYRNYPDLKNEADSREMYAYFGIFNQIIMEDNYKENKYYSKIKSYLRKNLISILKNPCITKNRKVSTLLLVISSRLYKIVLKKYMKGLVLN